MHVYGASAKNSISLGNLINNSYDGRYSVVAGRACHGIEVPPTAINLGKGGKK